MSTSGRRRRGSMVLASLVVALALGVAGTVAQAHVHLHAAATSSCVGCAVAHERSLVGDMVVRAPVVWDVVGRVDEPRAAAPRTRETRTPAPRGPPDGRACTTMRRRPCG